MYKAYSALFQRFLLEYKELATTLTKYGDLTVQTLTATTAIAVDVLANVVTGNSMRSGAYCDLTGNNCLGSSSAGFITLTVINGETLGDIIVANTLCQSVGHDGVWASMDKPGTEDVICYDSPMVQGVAQKQRFVTKYVALVWDPTFYAWAGGAASGFSRPVSYGPYAKWYDGFGWHIPQLGNPTLAQETADYLCSYFMTNGKADLSSGAFQTNGGTYSVADYGSDNGNTAWYWNVTTNSWGSYPHGSNGSIDLTQVTCTGNSVLPRGQKWLVANISNNGWEAHARYDAFWDKVGNWTNGVQANPYP